VTHPPLARTIDARTADDLRAAGSLKWTAADGAIGAWVAEMDFGTAPEVTRALHDVVDRGLLGYAPPALVERTSAAFAAFAADRYGWHVPAARVRPLPDVLAALAAAITHFTSPGSPVIVPTPAYMPFLELPRTLGREVLEVPLVRETGPDGRPGRYVYDLAALDAAFTAGGELLVLCNPHNPVGRVLEPAEMLAVADVVEARGGRVLADEIHAPLVLPGHRHVPYASLTPATARHTLTATSASKAWNLPGLKCAQVVLTNDDDVATWQRVGEHVEHGASTPGLVANAAAYEAGVPWLAEVLAYLDGNRRLLAEVVAERMPGVGHVPPEGTYLAWLDLRQAGPDGAGLGDRPADVLRERAGVAVVDGAACGEAGRGFVRVNLALPRPLLAEALERMVPVLGR
jgi:cystathionine beta-lyase